MSTPPKRIIVGTAGHIDHGKSALIEALTGTHPDRLEEERRRGITIDLGFAFLQTNSVSFGFVDVPGHERFVSNMLAGAAGIDLVLLVIAANESIKPQTREHFDICRLLGVQHGVVALTKSDLVNVDTLGLARLEVEEYLRGSFLEGAPIVAVSARTRAGLSELTTELQRVTDGIRSKDAGRNFRLPIDRAFTIKGFGAVVTGTLISGTVGAGDEVELFPRGLRLRVRGVQTGGSTVDRALAGQRTAVNLAGIEHSALKRGMVLAAPGKFRATRRFDAFLHLLDSAPALKQRSRVHLHAGTAETVAELSLLREKTQKDGELRPSLQPGSSAFAHIRMRDPVLLLPGDRFIVRQFSPVLTIGGGVVLDPRIHRPTSRDAGRIGHLKILQSNNPAAALASMLQRAPSGLTMQEIVARTGWNEDEVRIFAGEVVQNSAAKRVGADPLLLVPTEVFDEVRQKLLATIDRFHKVNPLVPGMTREDLRASVGRRTKPETFRAAIEELSAENKLELLGDLVKRAGASIKLDAEEVQAKAQIEAAFRNAGLAVPSVKEVLAKLPVEPGRAERILQMLLREKNLVRVSPELIFHRDALAHLRDGLSTYKKAKGASISVPIFKELAGISRKYAIPLLEYLDRERVTRRAGDERVIL
jgi:selenocysteine-specific elongation factor